MGPDDPTSPAGQSAGLTAAEGQSDGAVGQVCATCPDNWVEAGAIDETTGDPIPGLGYRIYDLASGDQVASGVLDEKGESPRHPIPQPVTQLYVVYGTEAAMDEAEDRIEEIQRQRALADNAVAEWNNIPAGLDEEGFNRAFDQESLRRGEMVRRNAGLIDGSMSGWKRAFDYVASGFDRASADREFYFDERAKSFDEYQLATGAREASRWESFGGGLGQGVTFGFGDEAMAGLDSMLSKRTYEEAVAARRQIMEAQRLANPGTFIGGEIAGAVPTIFVPVGGAAANAARAGQGARGAVTAGARAGAVTGGLSGAGHDEGGVLDRLDGAALGAVTGGTTGALLSGAGVMVVRGASKMRIWGRFSRTRAFQMDSDPARRVMGAGRHSHPDEVASMRAEMERAGVRVRESIGRDAMAYSPGRPGRPGELLMDPDASYAAWRHEYQHFLDDQASGWRGWESLSDPNTRWAWEQRAYAEEMRVIRKAGHYDIIPDVEALKTVEWNRIYRPDR